MADTLTLSEDDIVKWLQRNPDFLNQNPDVYDILHPPKQEQGKGIVDFQHYMVKRLKADRDDVLKTTREIVETSRANMSNQARVNNAVLMLLEAQDFEDFIRTVTMDLTSVLGVDIITMLVETQGDVIPHIDISGVRAVSNGTIHLMTENKKVILESNIAGLSEIYGGGAGLVKSQALLELHLAGDISPVLLAFGSRNPELFAPGQATDLLTFLGKVIERCFRIWIDIPVQG